MIHWVTRGQTDVVHYRVLFFYLRMAFKKKSKPCGIDRPYDMLLGDFYISSIFSKFNFNIKIRILKI